MNTPYICKYDLLCVHFNKTLKLKKIKPQNGRHEAFIVRRDLCAIITEKAVRGISPLFSSVSDGYNMSIGTVRLLDQILVCEEMSARSLKFVTVTVVVCESFSTCCK